MPCPRRSSAALQEMETTDDGVKMYTWRAVRRQHLRMLRKQTRQIVFFMAIMEILRVGAVDIVYAGKHDTKAPGPEDYGISYNVGHFMAWIYLCLFAIVWVPLFSWWVPKIGSDDPSTPSTGDKVVSILDKANNILLPACICIHLVEHVFYAVSAFIYVDGRPVDSSVKSPRSLNTRRNWLVRLLLLSGVVTSMTLGKASFMILESFDLAHLKPIEYMIIVMPIQINLGILMGSAVQFKAEQRRNRKLTATKAVDAEAATVDEKQNLIDA